MREIKFRFRYTDGAHWIFKVFTMQEMLNGDPFEVLSDNPLLRGYKLDGWDQFTGRKDKDGKEIYEGDIVPGNARALFVIIPMLGGLSMINIHNYGQQHNELIAMPTNDAQTAQWLRDREVVGNIYENPKLAGGE